MKRSKKKIKIITHLVSWLDLSTAKVHHAIMDDAAYEALPPDAKTIIKIVFTNTTIRRYYQ